MAKITRRKFLKSLIIGLASLTIFPKRIWSRPPPFIPKFPLRPLGKTGVWVSTIGLGGLGLLENRFRKEEGIKLINTAIDEGINYIDTARSWSYGPSESIIGEVMKKRRKEVFLATKTRCRTGASARKSIEGSLRSLQTDYIDLIQIHNLGYKSEIETVFSKSGALSALLKAKEEKLVRFIGITGHRDPLILMEALKRFNFDTILCPVNPADNVSPSFTKDLIPVAKEKGTGIIGMKIISEGRLLKKIPFKHALNYALSQDISVAIIGFEKIEELSEAIEIAKAFKPLDIENQKLIESNFAEKKNWNPFKVGRQYH